MEVLKDFKYNYPDDPISKMEFERFSDKAKECYLFLGLVSYAGHTYDLNKFNKNDKPKIVLTFEEPPLLGTNYFNDHINTFLLADKVLTTDVYMAEIFENREGCCTPFNQNYIPPITKKKYDSFMSCSWALNNSHIQGIKEVMSKFNSVLMCYTKKSPEINFINCTYEEKVRLMAESKIGITTHYFPLSSGSSSLYKKIPNYEKIKTFKNLDKGYITQMKCRTFEYAFCRCLILCYKDDWNVIERFFKPDKEFIYYNDMNDLSEKIKYISEHYSEFEFIVENAFQKAMNNYTVEKFIGNHIGWR